MKTPITVDTLIRQIEAPFIKRVMKVRVLSRFKLPSQLDVYEGKTNPMDHLNSYKNLMMIQGYQDEVMCKGFYTTLKSLTRTWFRKLSPGTINLFGDLSKFCIANFMSYQGRQKNVFHLFTIH